MCCFKSKRLYVEGFQDEQTVPTEVSGAGRLYEFPEKLISRPSCVGPFLPIVSHHCVPLRSVPCEPVRLSQKAACC